MRWRMWPAVATVVAMTMLVALAIYVLGAGGGIRPPDDPETPFEEDRGLRVFPVPTLPLELEESDGWKVYPFRAFPIGTEEAVWLEAMQRMGIGTKLFEAADWDHWFLTTGVDGRHDYSIDPVEYLGLPTEGVYFRFQDGALEEIYACFYEPSVPLAEREAFHAEGIGKFVELLEALAGYGYTQPEGGYILWDSLSGEYEYYDYPIEGGVRDVGALTRAICSPLDFDSEWGGLALIELYHGLTVGMFRTDALGGWTSYELFMQEYAPEQFSYPEEVEGFRGEKGSFPE